MKKGVLALVALLYGGFIIAGTPAISTSQQIMPDSSFKTTVINVYDTVVFDLSQEVNTANTVEFPVYFLSDDTVNALDFSLKFDMSKFAFDTIFDLTNYLTEVSHLAPDSVLRLTSYSLQRITNDTPLVSIRFIKLTGQPLCKLDIDSIYSYPIHGYLNGDPCAVKVTECNTTGITEINNYPDEVKIYPNPTSGKITLEYKSAIAEKYHYQILDLAGRILLAKEGSFSEGVNFLESDLSAFAKGVYVLKINSATINAEQRIVVQ